MKSARQLQISDIHRPSFNPTEVDGVSDKAVAMIVTTLIAAPLAVVCCAIGPAAFLAFEVGLSPALYQL